MASVSATVANNQFGQVLEAALMERVAITTTGRKVAVLLSWREYERLQALEVAWWAEQASKAEALPKIGDRPRPPKRGLRGDVVASPRFSSRRVRPSLLGDCPY